MNPITFNPLQLKLLAVGAVLAAAAIGSLTIWALLERNGRLECKVDLVQERAQLAVISRDLREQSAAIAELAQGTARGRRELREIVERIEKGHAATRAGVDRLEKAVNDPTPRRADGALKGCLEALQEWREERRR